MDVRQRKLIAGTTDTSTSGMQIADFAGARTYALRRLEQELSPDLLYHSIAHTRDDVVPAAERLAAMEGVRGLDLLLLRTAAYYHDPGLVRQRVGHEAAGAAIAAEVLPRFGYRGDEIMVVWRIIMATRMPQSPRTLLEQIMADADLDMLGREDFLQRIALLREELARFDGPVSDEAWYVGQLKFLQSHRYFTNAARTLRDAQKQANIALLESHLVAV